MNVTYVEPTQSISQSVRLIFATLFCIFVGPSLLCFFLNFYYFIRFRAQLIYRKLHYHFIICLLISDFLLVFTQLPLTLINLYTGSIPKISKLCDFWIYCTYTLFCVSDFLTMFGSIQRYLLVFHKVFFTKWKAILHYPTLIFCCLYPPIYYLYYNFFYPCMNNYNYTQALCGQPCFSYVAIEVIIDYFVHILFPVLSIIVVNCMLLLKVVRQKRRVTSINSTATPTNRRFWKKNRRLIMQLLTIASATAFAWLPFLLSAIVQAFHNDFISGDVLTLLN